MSIEYGCSYCDKTTCYGECQNYILDIANSKKDSGRVEDLLKQMPKIKYALNAKIGAIFGTELEIAKESEASQEKTKIAKNILYKKNREGIVNLQVIKNALQEKEIYKQAFVFYDNIEQNFYLIKECDLSAYKTKEKNPLYDEVLYYTVGSVELPKTITFTKTKRYIKQEAGYIISPSNILIFRGQSCILDSDTLQMQALIDINKKIISSTTYRDYGNVFLLTDKPKANVISATFNRIKDETEKKVKELRQKIVDLLSRNNTKDSHVITLDESYKSVEQVKPLNVVKDYAFVWEKQDDIVSSVINFPAILLNLGEASGNISKEAMIKDARANFLTPLKNETANILSSVCDQIFNEEGCYFRFKEYEETKV